MSLVDYTLALAEAKKEFQPIKRTKKHPHYKYAGLDDLLPAVEPALNSKGLYILPKTKVSEVSGKQTIVTGILHVPSKHLEESSLLMPDDVKPQDEGSAITYFRRYLLSLMLNVVTEDDDDGASASGKSESKPQTQSKSSAKTKEAPPPDPNDPDQGQAGYKKIVDQIEAFDKKTQLFILDGLIERYQLQIKNDWRSMDHPNAYVLKSIVRRLGATFDDQKKCHDFRLSKFEELAQVISMIADESVFA